MQIKTLFGDQYKEIFLPPIKLHQFGLMEYKI